MKIKLTISEFWEFARICATNSACYSCPIQGPCNNGNDISKIAEIVEEGADNAEKEADPDERA